MKRGDLEQRGWRDAEGLLRLGPCEQLARPASHAADISLDAPDPDMRVEQQHSSGAVDVVLAVDRIEGAFVLQNGAFHRSEERRRLERPVRNQLRDGLFMLRDDVLRTCLAYSIHQLQAPGLECGRGKAFAGVSGSGGSLVPPPSGPPFHDQNFMTTSVAVSSRPDLDAGHAGEKRSGP